MIMLLKKQHIEGRELSKEDIERMFEVVESDKYYVKEIIEMFGITKREYYAYKKIYLGEKELYHD